MAAGHAVLLFAGVALVILQCGKLVSTGYAIRWITTRGQDFKVLLEASGEDFSEQLHWELLERTDARSVRPFGVMEYRLFRLSSRLNAWMGRLIRLARALLFDFMSLGLASMVFLYLASAPMLSGYAGRGVRPVAVVSAVLLVAQLVALYAEACVSYVRLGSYGMAWHDVKNYSKLRKVSPYVTEIKTLAGAGLYSLGSGAFILYFTAAHGGRFTGLRVSGTTFAGSLRDLLSCSYYSFTTVFTADSPGPVSAGARLAVVSIVTQAVCALVLAFSTFALYVVPHAQAPAAPQPPEPDPPPQPEPDPDPVPVPDAGPAMRPGSVFLIGAVAGAVTAAVIRSALAGRSRPKARRLSGRSGGYRSGTS